MSALTTTTEAVMKVLRPVGRVIFRVADAAWTYCDPVTKVCYSHVAGHYHRKYRSKFPVHHSKVFYFDMFLLALLSFLLVLWFFVDALLPFVPLPQLVRIETLTPAEVVSGEDAEYGYVLRNDSDGLIGCAVLRVQLPAGTYVTTEVGEAGPSNRACNADGSDGALAWEDKSLGRLIYTVGDMGPHDATEIRFRTRSYGAIGDSQTTIAEFTYWEVSATQSSRVVARDTRVVAASALALEARLPEGVERGRAQTVTVGYVNAADHALEGVAIRISPPADFVVTGSSPAFTATREWRLGRLEAGATGELKLNGYFRALPAGSEVASVFALRGYVSEAGAPNVLAASVRVNADPRAADLEFAQELLSPRTGEAVTAGGTVRVAIYYRNAGTRTLRDLQVTVDAGAPLIAGLSAEAPPTVTFDRQTVNGLAQIDPGEHGVLTAEFKVKDVITAEELGTLPYPALHVSSRGEYNVDDASGFDEETAVRVETETVDLAIASRLGLEAAALYYSKAGDQLGVGPLPPTVGQETKYRVFLSVSATTGTVENAVVEAVLPEGVRWAGGSSVNNGSAIDYLPLSRRIRWQVGTIPAWSEGDDASRIGATFEVAITPSAEQIGTSPSLLSDIDMHGIDAATELPVHATSAGLTTDLPYDVRAAGKGAVQN